MTRSTRSTRATYSRILALPALALAATFSLGFAAAAPAAAAELTPGAVIALAGTEHLWVVDGQGVAHLAGDAPSLAGRAVNWNARTEVTLAELRAAPRGTPWLTTPLVRIGEAIYLPSFGANGQTPILQHVKSPDDLALLGVTGSTYGDLVMDKTTWEARYGFATEALQFSDFNLDGAPTVGPATPPTPSVDDASSGTA